MENDSSEYMSKKEVLEGLISIANNYENITAMCERSLEFKKNKSTDPFVVNLLDAAIALQMYLKSIKEKNNELITETKKLLDNTLAKLVEN